MQISQGDSCLQPACFFLSQAEKKQHPLSESNSFRVHKPQSKKIAPLKTVLNYSNEAVIERFMSEYGLARAEALKIFKDLLRWLWLNALHSIELTQGVSNIPSWLGIRAEQMVIDEMWHVFLLYTDEYHAFCQKYFGFPIGHSPNDNANEVLSERELETYLLSYLTYVEQHLGPDTVFRWFEEYSETYSAENLLRLRIQVLHEKLDSYLHESKETL